MNHVEYSRTDDGRVIERIFLDNGKVFRRTLDEQESLAWLVEQGAVAGLDGHRRKRIPFVTPADIIAAPPTYVTDPESE